MTKIKSNGCGLCADACHEGAIGIVDGKAKLLREDYCDGLGDCLPACPMNAISFEEREAPAYNEAADYAQKLTQIFAHNDIRSVTVTRMTVPCCGGLTHAVQTAIQNSGKALPLRIVTISPDGKIS